MPDIATIGAALGSIKTATDIAKLIKNSSASLEEAEIKLKVADLIISLADAQMEIATIQEELLFKDKIISDLREKLITKDKVVWESPYYFTEEEGGRDGPFCQNCYNTNTQLIRLQKLGNGIWCCNACGNRVKDGSYVTPVPYMPKKQNSRR